MKLITRVSVFFLAALAAVLIIYSAAFYAFVRGRLVQQFDQELHAALNSLVAAVEVEPEEVKWQPLEHTIWLGSTQEPAEVRWVVVGDRQQVVERSRNASQTFVAIARNIAAEPPLSADGDSVVTSGDWQILHRRLAAPAPDRTERELDEFDEVTVVVARSSTPLRANLRQLLLLMCTLSSVAWLLAAAGGHWFCRRALQPVFDMSNQARSMTGADFHSRLPVSSSGDELADLALAFNTLLDRQHRAFEQQRRFAGDAAHELRTPVTVLLGQIDVSLRRLRTPEEYANTLRLLRDQSAELQRIIESLLFLARSDADAVLPNCETFLLGEWLADYLNRWNEHPRRGDLSLHIEAGTDCQITASSALLARLLDNLIENALKYSAVGTSVEITLTCEDGMAAVSVEDHGHGISAEDQAAIFEPFYRTRSAREAGIAGTGLGLAIAARIATVLGGRLTCASKLGRGTRFTLYLPMAMQHVTEDKLQAGPLLPSSRSVPLPK